VSEETTAELPEDVAPRSAPKKRATTRKPAATRGKRGKHNIEAEWRVLLSMIGTGWQAADATCGGAFLAQVPDLARALNLWAQESDDVYRMLTGFSSSSGPFGLMLAGMPVLQSVAAHHILPAVQRRREAAANRAEVVGWDPEQAERVGEVLDAVAADTYSD
jgi:hypothetical protein